VRLLLFFASEPARRHQRTLKFWPAIFGKAADKSVEPIALCERDVIENSARRLRAFRRLALERPRLSGPNCSCCGNYNDFVKAVDDFITRED
jgi:hypothetical protein